MSGNSNSNNGAISRLSSSSSSIETIPESDEASSPAARSLSIPIPERLRIKNSDVMTQSVYLTDPKDLEKLGQKEPPKKSEEETMLDLLADAMEDFVGPVDPVPDPPPKQPETRESVLAKKLEAYLDPAFQYPFLRRGDSPPPAREIIPDFPDIDEIDCSNFKPSDKPIPTRPELYKAMEKRRQERLEAEQRRRERTQSAQQLSSADVKTQNGNSTTEDIKKNVETQQDIDNKELSEYYTGPYPKPLKPSSPIEEGTQAFVLKDGEMIPIAGASPLLRLVETREVDNSADKTTNHNAMDTSPPPVSRYELPKLESPPIKAWDLPDYKKYCENNSQPIQDFVNIPEKTAESSLQTSIISPLATVNTYKVLQPKPDESTATKHPEASPQKKNKINASPSKKKSSTKSPGHIEKASAYKQDKKREIILALKIKKQPFDINTWYGNMFYYILDKLRKASPQKKESLKLKLFNLLDC